MVLAPREINLTFLMASTLGKCRAGDEENGAIYWIIVIKREK
jgi:hypothetical protein